MNVTVVKVLSLEGPEQLLQHARELRPLLDAAKQQPPAPDLNWYAYDTLAGISHVERAIHGRFADFTRSLASGPVLDIGCADGDLSFYFAKLGFDVTAIDNRPTNFNWMTGIRTLSDRLQLPVNILDLDIDSNFQLPERDYGLTLLLGILYHLKNPYYVLEALARKSRYCLLSTRIAQVTPRKTKIEHEPLVYLLDPGETNQDSSNYWIFSPAALVRLAERSGWKILSQATVGCTKRSDPVRADRDGRMFLFLRSALLSAPVQIQKIEGLSAPTSHEWAWTLRRFAFQVKLLSDLPSRSFAFRFRIPEVVTCRSAVKLSCSINGNTAGIHTYTVPGDHTFEGALPDAKEMHFEFSVKHSFQPAPPERRALGIIVSLRREIYGVSEPIPLWLD